MMEEISANIVCENFDRQTLHLYSDFISACKNGCISKFDREKRPSLHLEGTACLANTSCGVGCRAYVYFLVCLNNKYIYVGCTSNPITRFIEHYYKIGSKTSNEIETAWKLLHFFEVDNNKKYSVEAFLHSNEDLVKEFISSLIEIDTSSMILLEAKTPENFQKYIQDYQIRTETAFFKEFRKTKKRKPEPVLATIEEIYIPRKVIKRNNQGDSLAINDGE